VALKRKPYRRTVQGAAWMVTFADMVTLLLAFFVLLLSMSSMDRSVLRDVVSNFAGDMGLAPKKGAGRIPTRFSLVQEAIENPADVLDNPQRIKDLLFPDEVLPEGMSRSTLAANLEILARPDGLALVLSDGLLFETGGSELGEASRKLLDEFARFLATTTMPVNVAGYTDNIPGGTKDNYVLSSERAMAVLGFFLQKGFDPGRFSVSAYGEAFPLGDNATPEGRARNRRVEILLKTTGRTYL
jgi:chemotaxis protein MotB